MEQSRYLAPMGLGEILDASVRLYRRNFRSLVMAQLPMTVFYLVTNAIPVYILKIGHVSILDLFTGSEITVTNGGGYSLVVFILELIMYPLTVAAVIKVASDSVLQHPVSAKDAYKFCTKILLKLITTNIVLGLVIGIAIGVPLGISFAILYLMMPYSFSVAGILITFILIIVGLLGGGFVWIRLIITFVVAVNEQNFNTGAIGRSWNMVKGYALKMFMVMFLIYLIPTVFEMSPDIMEMLYRIPSPGLSLVFGTISLGILIPLVESTRVITYFQLRVRKEGFDLTQKMEKLSSQS